LEQETEKEHVRSLKRAGEGTQELIGGVVTRKKGTAFSGWEKKGSAFFHAGAKQGGWEASEQHAYWRKTNKRKGGRETTNGARTGKPKSTVPRPGVYNGRDRQKKKGEKRMTAVCVKVAATKPERAQIKRGRERVRLQGVEKKIKEKE